ncbi:alpha/beta fold hydrolase [Candidatus Pacearchaeota archaeon]|nr:alpha/beta fold hydrolase [Candidatus Pacearchaeota archaeon]
MTDKITTLVDPRAETIELNADSDREFFLVHGYTGSPTDFNGLGKYLHERFNANVKIIRLLGHGENINSLNNLGYEDFLKQVEEEFLKDLEKGRQIVVGGYSFGSYPTLYLASKYPVSGVFNVMIPYELKFPFNLRVANLAWVFGSHWSKRYKIKLSPKDPYFYYDELHVNAMKILRKAKRHIDSLLHKINSPILMVHTKGDIFAKHDSIKLIAEKVNSDIKKLIIFNVNKHDILFHKVKDKLFSEIGNFFEKNTIFGSDEIESFRGKARRMRKKLLAG